MGSLLDQIRASSYLTRLQSEFNNSNELDSLNVSDVEQRLEHLCAIFESYVIEDLSVAEAALLAGKAEFNYVWSLAALSQRLSQAALGRWQTQFAQNSIDFALRIAWLSTAVKHKAIAKDVLVVQGRVPGLFIFGMGKLGGYDLNFSSDVDLVAYFDPTILPVPEMLGKSYVCHQVLQSLTRLLSQGGASNFVWRVDWRLRPNASATTLAMSVEAAEDYYFYRASPWHRLALMKARVIAGDINLGEEFKASLTPFIWRQNLDYRAVDELAEIKQRINLEHPSLRVQRQWSEPISNDIAGFNVKLGSGGIREIEFITNALQLLWGGRNQSLRTSNTLEALQVLSQLDKLDEGIASQLTEAYQQLRCIENAIQLLENQQTHLIPSSEHNQQNLLVLLDLTSWQSLVELLNPVRYLVHQTFSDLFAEQSEAQGEQLEWPTELSAQAEDIILTWEEGYINYGVSNQVRHRLKPLTQGISNYLATSELNANDTIIRLHEFFRSLPSGEQYFRLLAKSPALLSSIVQPLMHSPPMTLLLKQSPHIVDCYVHSQWRYPQGFDSRHVTQADDYGEQLERLRRFVNEYLYQLYLSFMKAELSVSQFQLALTELAEQTLDLALELVAKKMGLDYIPITVVGMGKVALRKMSPLSDLDLIFIFDQEQTSLELASRYVSRLQTAIATPMREGIVYELDTRLRPSGRSGAPTVSIESFAKHHHTRAHTWEHIALVPSRVVAGNRALETRFNEIKAELITKPRDKVQFVNDAQKMWNRIAEHRVKPASPEVMLSKLCHGGLMQAEYLAACTILFEGSNLPANSVEFDALLSEAGAEPLLSKSIEFWRIQQLWERLLERTDLAVSSVPLEYLPHLFEQSEVGDLDGLFAKKISISDFVQAQMSRLFSEHHLSESEIEQWLETQVSWQ